ncbi:hypothetical protein K435DRAFT_863962 [Dendrothele bispora CBS 962.96]|uniref:Uncharacterized protein n=1 Tax=Dendrothele bispora (strain CBS 962.96) TaxID=1314807 RepID=A0A4V4HEH3_DENBC|nr:hypothetical protein K435DRAFT_863962 [Dendrothele bispora CBS 962.96]
MIHKTNGARLVKQYRLNHLLDTNIHGSAGNLNNLVMDQTRYVNQTFYRDYGLEAKILRGTYSMHISRFKELPTRREERIILQGNVDMLGLEPETNCSLNYAEIVRT